MQQAIAFWSGGKDSGLALDRVRRSGTHEDYVPALCSALEIFKARGITQVIFGDIFLEDLRQWRESLLGGLGMAGVDPCGENGEYHSFIYDGPVFRHPVAFAVGETVYRPLASASEAAAPRLDERSLHAASAESSGRPASSGPQFVIPAPAGPTATRGFWFVDLLPA